MEIEDIDFEDIQKLSEVQLVAFAWAEGRHFNQEYFLRIFDQQKSGEIFLEFDETDPNDLLRRREKYIVRAFRVFASNMSAHEKAKLFDMIETVR